MSITKRGAVYRARLRDHDGREHTRHFSLRRDAEAWEAQMRADLIRGTFVDPKRGEMTVRGYSEEWLAAQSLKPSTEALYVSHLRNHIIPALGSKRLMSVTPTSVRGFVKHLGTKLAPATVSTVHGITAMLFKSAVADGYLARTPCVKTAPKAPRPRRVIPLAPEEIHRLAGAMPERLSALVYCSAGLGLRQGEVLGLTVARVRFLDRRVQISEQLQTLPDGRVMLVPPKTPKSDRTVPLPAFVADAVSSHLSSFPVGPSGLVFTTPKGEPWHRSRFGDVWRAAVERAGLPKGTRLHDLRHTYVAMLIAAGEHPKVIQDRLGHASITETMDTYGHLFPAAEEGTRDAIDRAFSGAVADSVRTGAVVNRL